MFDDVMDLYHVSKDAYLGTKHIINQLLHNEG